MKTDNPFDRKIEAQKRMPEHFRDAAIELTDTLDLAWAAARAVFEKQAKPEHAIALLPMFMIRADAKRPQQAGRAPTRTAGASSKAPRPTGRRAGPPAT